MLRRGSHFQDQVSKELESKIKTKLNYLLLYICESAQFKGFCHGPVLVNKRIPSFKFS